MERGKGGGLIISEGKDLEIESVLVPDLAFAKDDSDKGILV